MQGKLERGKAAFQIPSAGSSVSIWAGASFIAAMALFAPDHARAACGGASAPAGIHAGGGGGGGVHVATSRPATSAGGGGGGTLGCAGGSSGSALHGLPTTSSGRVVETGAHMARTEGRP